MIITVRDILMNSYLVVSKSMITKVIEMGEKLYKRKEAQLLQMNELSSSDGYKYATINKQIDLYPDYKKGKINESYDKAIAAFREDIMPLFSKLRIRIRADVDYNSAMSPLS